MGDSDLPDFPDNENDRLDFYKKLRIDINNHWLIPPTMPETVKKYLFFGRSWRLNAAGKKTFSKYFNEYELNNTHGMLTGKILIKMDDCCNGPYYITNNKITVFNISTYFELQLLDGDLNKFVDFKT